MIHIGLVHDKFCPWVGADSQNAGLSYRLIQGRLFWECPNPRALPYTYCCATASGWCVPEIMGPQPPISGSPQPWGVTLRTKTCPYFSSVFRWPLSDTRTQPVSSEMEEIFHSRSSHPLKIRADIYNKEWPYPSPVHNWFGCLVQAHFAVSCFFLGGRGAHLLVPLSVLSVPPAMWIDMEGKLVMFWNRAS